MNTMLYISGFVAIISTLMVITRKNAVHALLYLIVSLLSVALVFFVLGAPFVAALEVIIYAGAIMVLFVFVIMMLNVRHRVSETGETMAESCRMDRACMPFRGSPRRIDICYDRQQHKADQGQHGGSEAGGHLPLRPLSHRCGTGLDPPAFRPYRSNSSRPPQ